jgi:hypothetical protein
MSVDEPEMRGESGAEQMQPQTKEQSKQPAPPGTREFTFPLMDGAAVLRVPHPMGQENYDLLKAVLEAAKSALIGQKKTDGPPA